MIEYIKLFLGTWFYGILVMVILSVVVVAAFTFIPLFLDWLTEVFGTKGAKLLFVVIFLPFVFATFKITMRVCEDKGKARGPR